MNLDISTPQQRAIITTLDAPLMVEAGAGSGKTFTLTQRIAYALLPASPDEAPFLHGIDEVLAITFTKKAAAELKARIKSLLLQEGLTDAALGVDDAWISTIHGMCARILREHALELGIDPAFEVLEEYRARELFAKAFEQVATVIRTDDSLEHLRRLLGQRTLMGFGSRSAGIIDQVNILLSRVHAMPGGFSSLVLGQTDLTPSCIMRSMIELGDEYRMVSETWSSPTKTDMKYLDQLSVAMERAQHYLPTISTARFTDEEFDPARFMRVFFSFPKTSPLYRSKKEDADFFDDYRLSYARWALEVEVLCARGDTEALIELARLVDDEYKMLKGPSCFDNDDLLMDTYRALCGNEDLARHYRDRFSLIMIDEFQDTDKLQVAIIGALAKEDASNICTVGDAQQSIYRFRGADVNVFYDFRDDMKAKRERARFISLPDNFRSHRDILHLVDRIFEQSRTFGDRFLSLKPRSACNDVDDPIFRDRSRVELHVFDAQGKAHIEDARLSAARAIARHFASLRAAGSSPADMVVLLGAMSNADVYAQALADEGFDSIMAGGSLFATAPEVDLMGSILRLGADVRDERALYEVLSSPLFSLSDKALLVLREGLFDGERCVRRTLSAGFFSDDDWAEILSPDEQEGLSHARFCLNRFFSDLDSTDVVSSVRGLLSSSGWFGRLEGQGSDGLAVAGNVLKALRIIEEIDAISTGISRTSLAFSSRISDAKEAPGILTTTSADFVRIMTVHASKGLEFPHVALAELRDGTMAGSRFLVENVGDETFVVQRATLDSASEKTAKELRDILGDHEKGLGEDVLKAQSPGALASALQAFTRKQELEEARRLLYVALTRAGKSLCMALAIRGNKEFDYERKGVIGDLYAALKWEKSASAVSQSIEYGAELPASMTLTVLTEPIDEPEHDGVEDLPFVIFDRPSPRPSVYPSVSSRGTAVFSYSSFDEGFVPMPVEGEYVFGESFLREGEQKDSLFDEVSADLLSRRALSLGLAFHRLAQRAIECCGEDRVFIAPSHEEILTRAQSFALDEEQCIRLRNACDLWFSSEVARRFCDHRFRFAEVPFMVALDDGGETLFLEGEIDALAYDDETTAYFVDYKTGGAQMRSEEELLAKHRLQAQCYAYALLRQGFVHVEATFVRVECADLAKAGEPQTLHYSFEEGDLDVLEATILEACRRSRRRDR